MSLKPFDLKVFNHFKWHNKDDREAKKKKSNVIQQV